MCKVLHTTTMADMSHAASTVHSLMQSTSAGHLGLEHGQCQGQFILERTWGWEVRRRAFPWDERKGGRF